MCEKHAKVVKEKGEMETAADEKEREGEEEKRRQQGQVTSLEGKITQLTAKNDQLGAHVEELQVHESLSYFGEFVVSFSSVSPPCILHATFDRRFGRFQTG